MIHINDLKRLAEELIEERQGIQTRVRVFATSALELIERHKKAESGREAGSL